MNSLLFHPSPSGVSGRSSPRDDLKLPGAVSPETGQGVGTRHASNLWFRVPTPTPPLKGRGFELDGNHPS
jgi:hypothetical protein